MPDRGRGDLPQGQRDQPDRDQDQEYLAEGALGEELEGAGLVAFGGRVAERDLEGEPGQKGMHHPVCDEAEAGQLFERVAAAGPLGGAAGAAGGVGCGHTRYMRRGRVFQTNQQ
jgi:hypothetical protein